MPETIPPDAESPSPDIEPTEHSLADAVQGARDLVEMMSESQGTRVRLDLGGLRLEVQTDSAHAAPPEQSAEGEPAQPAADCPPDERSGRSQIIAPLVGAFYRRPTPADQPFISVGDRVVVGQQVAIVEAMKLMNAVLADRAGVVLGIHAEDGDVVEYDQVIFTIETD